MVYLFYKWVVNMLTYVNNVNENVCKIKVKK